MRAGLPATIVHGGTSLVTILPAPTTAPSPIVTPFKTIARTPIHALFEILTGAVATVDQSLVPCSQSLTSFRRSRNFSE